MSVLQKDPGSVASSTECTRLQQWHSQVADQYLGVHLHTGFHVALDSVWGKTRHDMSKSSFQQSNLRDT